MVSQGDVSPVLLYTISQVFTEYLCLLDNQSPSLSESNNLHQTNKMKDIKQPCKFQRYDTSLSSPVMPSQIAETPRTFARLYSLTGTRYDALIFYRIDRAYDGIYTLGLGERD